MRYRVRLLVPLFALILVGLGVSGVQAQPTDQIAAITINLSITTIDETGESLTVASVTGQVNRTGEVSLSLTSPFDDGAFDVIVIGSRVYYRSNGGVWQYVESSDFSSTPAPGTGSSLPAGCGDQAPNFTRLVNPLTILQSFVNVTNLGPEQIGVIPVTHYRGDIDIRGGLNAITSLLLLDPDCAAVQNDLTTALEEIQPEDLPATSLDAYIGRDNSFPYRLVLTIDFDDGKVALLADLAPSTTRFGIVAPAGAVPARR